MKTLKKNPYMGLKKAPYYEKIARTRDLLKPKNYYTSNKAFDLVTSDFYIAPSSVHFDAMVEEVIFELNSIIVNQIKKLPFNSKSKSDEIINHLKENFPVYKKDSNVAINGNVFKNRLQELGYTGVLIKVASGLNSSTIDQFSRAILSEEGVFFYLAYRVIEGYGIKDEKGIASKLLRSIGLIKSYINVKLIGKIIDKENLNVNKEEKRKLEKRIKNEQISYYEGNPKNTIVKLIQDVKTGGELYTYVMDFLTSNEVTLSSDTNIEVLAKKMVDYLKSIGYKGKFKDTQDEDIQVMSTSTPSPNIVPDNLSVIEGIGNVTKNKLTRAGVKTFNDLANYSEDELESIEGITLIKVTAKDIIAQALLISKGKFRELKVFQDKIN